MLGAGAASSRLDGALVSVTAKTQRLVIRLVPEQRAAALMRRDVIDHGGASGLTSVSCVWVHTDGVLGKVALPILLPSRIVSAFAAGATRLVFPRTLLFLQPFGTHATRVHATGDEALTAPARVECAAWHGTRYSAAGAGAGAGTGVKSTYSRSSAWYTPRSAGFAIMISNVALGLNLAYVLSSSAPSSGYDVDLLTAVIFTRSLLPNDSTDVTRNLARIRMRVFSTERGGFRYCYYATSP